MPDILVDSDILKSILKELQEIKSIVLSDKTNAQWLSERQAAAMLGYKSVKRMRELIKAGSLAIDYTTTNGRAYQYSRKSIEKYLKEHSTITKLSNI